MNDFQDVFLFIAVIAIFVGIGVIISLFRSWLHFKVGQRVLDRGNKQALPKNRS